MATKTLSQVIGGGGGGLPKLAVDTDYPKDKLDGNAQLGVSFNPSGTLTTALDLTGKFIIIAISLSSVLANNIAQIKLTVDGVVVWDVDPLTNATAEFYIGGIPQSGNDGWSEAVICESSFKFEVKTDSDSAVTLNYLVRPIL